MKEFKVIEECMMSDEPTASLNGKEQSSDAKKNVCEVGIIGMHHNHIKSSAVANVISAGPNHAVKLCDVACLAMGCNPITSNESRYFLCSWHKMREPGEVANKAPEKNPQLPIIPIQSCQQCPDWNGKGCDVLVLLGTNENDGGHVWAVGAVGMTKKQMKDSHSSKEELELGLALMNHMAHALVQSLVCLDPLLVHSNADKEASDAIKDAIEQQRDCHSAFTAIMGMEAVHVPEQGCCFSIHKIHFGEFKKNFSPDTEKNSHSPPDLLLLVAWAAAAFLVCRNI